MRTPGRTGMLKKPTRVTHQALLLDQGLNIMLVFAHLGFVTACISGQNIRVLTKPFWESAANTQQTESFQCSNSDALMKRLERRREQVTHTHHTHTHTTHTHTHTHHTHPTPHTPHPTHTHPHTHTHTHTPTPHTPPHTPPHTHVFCIVEATWQNCYIVGDRLFL